MKKLSLKYRTHRIKRLFLLSSALCVSTSLLCSFWGGTENPKKVSAPMCGFQVFEEPKASLVSINPRALNKFTFPWEKTPESALLALIDYSTLGHIATSAEQVKRFRRSRGLCMRGVHFALNRAYSRDPNRWTFHAGDLSVDRIQSSLSNKKSSHAPMRSAEHFHKWASQNPVSLCRNLGLVDITHIQSQLPSQKGLIHVYPKGECGFSRKYGHIEAIVDDEGTQACSDHCRLTAESTKRANCKPSMILAPVTDCDAYFLKSHPKKAPSHQEEPRNFCLNGPELNLNMNKITL